MLLPAGQLFSSKHSMRQKRNSLEKLVLPPITALRLLVVIIVVHHGLHNEETQWPNMAWHTCTYCFKTCLSSHTCRGMKRLPCHYPLLGQATVQTTQDAMHKAACTRAGKTEAPMNQSQESLHCYLVRSTLGSSLVGPLSLCKMDHVRAQAACTNACKSLDCSCSLGPLSLCCLEHVASDCNGLLSPHAQVPYKLHQAISIPGAQSILGQGGWLVSSFSF